MKDQLREIKQVIKQLNVLAHNFNTTYKNKTVTFAEEFRGVEEDGYNFKVRRIIPEEDSIELVYDVFEKDEQIKCTEFISIYEFIKHAR